MIVYIILYRKILLEAASKVGIAGAEEWLNDPKAGVKEVCHRITLSLSLCLSITLYPSLPPSNLL
jgi:hypothetical protein